MARSYVREARRGLGRRRDRIGPIIERLAAEHADAQIALRFRSDLELLVSVMLSAQTTDVNVNKVTPALFEKYRTPEDYLAVPHRGARSATSTRPASSARRRSPSAGRCGCSSRTSTARSRAGSTDLVKLPGVARKTANVVASELGHAQGIVVDTHVRRLSQRLGLTRQEDPVKIERDLQRVVPRADWARFPHLLIWHGRRICDARRPRCEDCVIEDLCPSSRLPAPGSRVAAIGRGAAVFRDLREWGTRFVGFPTLRKLDPAPPAEDRELDRGRDEDEPGGDADRPVALVELAARSSGRRNRRSKDGTSTSEAMTVSFFATSFWLSAIRDWW